MNNDPSETTSKTSQGRFEGGFIRILRAVSIIALIAGAIGSLGFMFREGQQTPRLLLVLFTIWILSPFAALFWAITLSKRWSLLTRATLYFVTLIVALGSLAIYGELVDIRPSGSATAFLFVIVPSASVIFIAIVVPIAMFISSRLSRRSDSASSIVGINEKD